MKACPTFFVIIVLEAKRRVKSEQSAFPKFTLGLSVVKDKQSLTLISCRKTFIVGYRNGKVEKSQHPIYHKT